MAEQQHNVVRVDSTRAHRAAGRDVCSPCAGSAHSADASLCPQSSRLSLARVAARRDLWRGSSGSSYAVADGASPDSLHPCRDLAHDRRQVLAVRQGDAHQSRRLRRGALAVSPVPLSRRAEGVPACRGALREPGLHRPVEAVEVDPAGPLRAAGEGQEARHLESLPQQGALPRVRGGSELPSSSRAVSASTSPTSSTLSWPRSWATASSSHPRRPTVPRLTPVRISRREPI